MKDTVRLMLESLEACEEASVQQATECLEEAEDFIGESDFPLLCREVLYASSLLSKAGNDSSLKNLFYRRAFIFFADRGRGYNASVDLLYRLLAATGMFHSKPFQDTDIISKACENERDLLTCCGIEERYLQKDSSILSFDLSSIPALLNSPQMQTFLIHLRDKTKNVRNIVVFRLPYMDANQAQKAVQTINWFFTTTSVFFQPLTDENILQMADVFFQTLHCKLEPDARVAFLELVNDARKNGFFYGSHTVRKLADDLVTQKLSAKDAPNETISRVMVVQSPRYQDMLTRQKPLMTMAQVFAPLDNMVGMEEISREVKGIVRSILYAKTTGQSLPALHMVLTGNPGTGKTSVARVIAEALKHSKVLSVGKCVECTSADLIGRYVGSTGPQTRALCQSAYGSVLFIDEAYMLASNKQENSYGQEALAELISQMENHREDFVVILAGYADDMEQMLSVNVGMKRRLPYRIDIPFCNGEQLQAIYLQQLKIRQKKVQESGFKLEWDSAFEQHVSKYFRSIPEQVLSNKAFGNGGYARNLLEITINNAIARCSQDSLDELEYNLVLTEADFTQAASRVKQL